jgi:hypothetical protein
VLAAICSMGALITLVASAVPASASGGSYNVENKNASGMCLEGASGRNAQLEPCGQGSYGGSNETFHTVAQGGGYYEIQNGFNQCLQTPEAAKGQPVYVGSCSDGDYEDWQVFTYGGGWCWFEAELGEPPLVLGVSGASKEAGADTVIWDEESGHNDQLWTCLSI